MGPVTISERFVAACSPVISSNYDTCGTVTKASISHLNVSQLTALFAPGGLFADLDAWFKHSVEMKACGTKRYALYDWIMANSDREAYRGAVTGVKGVKVPSLIQPFVFGRQETVVNRDHWKVTNGWTKSAYDGLNGADGSDTYPVSAAQLATAGVSRILQIETRYGLSMDVNWFRTGESLHVFSRAGNGATRHGQWRVLAAASNSAKTFIHVAVADANGGSSELYDATVTTGVMVPGVNNVNDYERWCQNLPTIDPRKRVPFWIQTFRTARCVDSEYKEVFAKLMETNAAFREFGDLAFAERNKQDEMEMQKRFVNEFFYNKPISAYQNLTDWESLEAINTVDGSVINIGLGSKIQSRRANFVGVREQLRVCDRLFDLQNNALNMEEFLQLNYDIKRARESQGRRVTDIDWWTDSIFRARFQTAMFQYYKDQYLDMLRATVQVNQMNDQLGIVYDSYQVKRPGGVRINILSDEYFDDWRDEFDDQSIGSVGTRLLCLDLGKPGPSGGTIYWAQIAANRRVYQTAKIEELARIDPTYRCVMEINSLEQTLKSETGTVICECPKNSAWIEGIADLDPVTTGRTTPSYTNLY
jgi:hypothetical protein